VNAAQLLREVAAGRSGGDRFVYRPGPTAAFGRLDRLRPGYEAAQAVAREHGLEPILREGGGHAVVYDDRSAVLGVTSSSTTERSS